jgi:hypothetical protein
MNNIQKTARFAGILYLIITVAAIVAHIYMPSELIVAGDATATAQNINNSTTFFRLGGIGSELIILLSEVILSIVLFVLLKPVNKVLSMLAAVSRLVMTTVHAFNLINYFFVIILLGGSSYLSVFNAEQINALSMLFLEAHGFGFTIGIAFLVIHVIILGYLIIKSGYFPKVLGYLFLAAGLGYLIDSFGLLLFANYETTPTIIAIVISVSELVFPLWLLIKGVNRDRYQERITSTN